MEVPAVQKEGIRCCRVERNRLKHECRLTRMILAHGDAGRHVAIVVAHGVQVAVVFAVGVEVSAGSLEVGCVTDRILVDMDGVDSKLEVLELNFDLHAVLDGLEGCKAGVLTG